MKNNKLYLIKDLAQVYLNNRSVNMLLNSSAIDRVEIMVKYLLKAAKHSGGIILSEDEKVAAVYLKRKKDLWGKIKEYIWINIFIKYVIGADCSAKFKAHQRYVSEQYPDREIMQIVLLSLTIKTLNDPRHMEVMNNLIEISNKSKTPIYLETSTPPFIPFFEKFGFDMYHEWDRGVNDFPLWFYKRECENMMSK